MAKKPKYPKFDKSLLKDGSRIEGSEKFITTQGWEGWIDRRGLIFSEVRLYFGN